MTVDTHTIRPATAADADAIATLLADAFAEFAPLYTPDGFRATTPTREEIAQRITDGPVWVVESGSRIAGTVSAVRRADGVHVRSMAVAPAARGLGLGRVLLDQVQAFADAEACDHLVLEHDAVSVIGDSHVRTGWIRADERAAVRALRDAALHNAKMVQVRRAGVDFRA